MRLTLRTLLAYLDDTLEPAQAKQIGQKVAESEVAQQLIARIKHSLKRRSLQSPPVGSGSKIDANTVAEYLDNLLAEKDLADVEDVLLSSDLYLAEVASAHQVLTMFLGQPEEVGEMARKRMYGLMKSHATPVPPSRRGSRQLPPDPDDLDDDLPPQRALPMNEDGSRHELPAFLNRDELARRAGPALGILVLVTLLIVGIWQMSPKGDKPTETQLASNSTQPDTKSAPDTKAVDTKPSDAKTDVKPPDNGKGPDTKTGDSKTDLKPADPVEPPPTKVSLETKDLPKINPERREIGKQVTAPGTAGLVLLHRATAKDQWQRVAKDGPVSTAETLLSLPGMKNDIRLETGVLLTLAGNVPEFNNDFPAMESVVVLHVPEPGFDADVTLENGRIIIANLKPDGEAKVRVRFLDEVWEIFLKDNQTVVALDKYSLYPPEVPFSKDGSGEGPTCLVNLYSLKGQSAVKIRYRLMDLPTPSFYQWNNRTGPASSPQKFPLPRWFTDKAPPKDNQLARDMLLAIDELNLRLNTKPVDIALAETRKDAKPANRVLTVRCLEATDATSELMDILGSPDEKDDILSREHAIDALRTWIGRQPGNELKLYKSLQEKMGYTPLQAEIVLELLHFFSKEARENVETYEKLIENLADKKAAIRLLSYAHLFALVPEGRKLPYSPISTDVEARQRGYLAWKALKEAGKIPPKPNAPARPQ